MSRPTARERGYDFRWKKVRAMKLKRSPLCEWCLERKIYTKATLVHHIEEVSKVPEKRLVMSNLWSACHTCHERHHKQDQDRGCNQEGTPNDPNHFWNM